MKKRKRRQRPSPEFVRQNATIGPWRDGEWLNPCEYISWVKEILENCPNVPLIIYIRVSLESQRSHLNNYREAIILQCKEFSATVIYGPFEEVRRGYTFDPDCEFIKACNLAKKMNGIVVTFSTDRFLRSEQNDSSKSSSPYLPKSDLERLKTASMGVPLATILKPDKNPFVVRGIQSKLGMKTKGHNGGRPKKELPETKSPKVRAKPGAKKARRETNKYRAIRMRRHGYTLQKISDKMEVPISTIFDWINK